MSDSYKKAFRSIPFAKKFLLDAVFAVDNDHCFGGAVDYFNPEQDEVNVQAYNFLEKSMNAFVDCFNIYIGDSTSTRDSIYFVFNPMRTPKIKSKKSRALKHAKLVAMSKENRRVKRDNQRDNDRLPKVDLPGTPF